MKKGFLALAILSGATALVLSACADDVIDVTNQEKYAIVDELDSNSCTEEMEGAMQLVKSEGLLYACSDGKWFVVNPEEAVDFRCKSEPLKDSSGYKILCDGEEIGIVKSGKDGKDADPKAGESGVNGKSAYELAKEHGYTGTEEEWLESLAGADGEAAYELAKKNGYTGTKEEFLESLNGADGKTLYELETENGYKGSEKDLHDSLDGKDAKSVNGDSISKVLESEIAKTLADSLKCKIDSSWIDDEKSEVNVKVSCGNGTKVITLPTLIPNKNLTTHYKKHVVVRFPIQSDYIGGEGGPEENYLEGLWSQVVSGNLVDLTVREVDEKFNQTGKKFVAELLGSDAKPFTTIEEVNGFNREYMVVRLEGDIDITNLMNSFALFRVNLDLSYLSDEQGRVSSVAYSAAVNLDDADTVVIDFLTDYKAARVKELLASKDFAEANAQANKELVSALYISENAGSYPSLEHFLPAQTGLNEYVVSTLWPVALAVRTNSQNFNTVYSDYRATFAKNGNLKAALKESFNGSVHSMFFADFLMLLVEGMNDDQDDISFADYAAYYKILQATCKEAYNLPDVDKDAVFQVTGDGYFEYFIYMADDKLWYPVVRGDMSSTDDDTQNKRTVFVNSLTGITCKEENEISIDGAYKKVAAIPFEGDTLFFTCEKEGYVWNLLYSQNDLNPICKEKENGDYVKLQISYNYGTYEYDYYRCKKTTDADNVTTISSVEVDAWEYSIGKPCDANTKDTLYTVPGNSNFIYCNHGTYNGFEYNYYGELHPESSSSEFQQIIKYQLGACDQNTKHDTAYVAYDRNDHQVLVECREYNQWKVLDSLNIAATSEYGSCNIEEMKKRKVYELDISEWYVSTLMANAFVKCDCERSITTNENQQRDTAYYHCDWTKADQLDRTLDGACVRSAMDEIQSTEDEVYICREISSTSSAWTPMTVNEFCEKNKEEAELLESVTPDDTYYYPRITHTCVFKNKMYVKDENSQYNRYWNDKDAYCLNSGAECTAEESSLSMTCIFMQGYKGQTPLYCNRSTESWEVPESVADWCDNDDSYLSGCGENYPSNHICTYPIDNLTYTCVGTVNGETTTYSWQVYTPPQTASEGE